MHALCATFIVHFYCHKWHNKRRISAAMCVLSVGMSVQSVFKSNRPSVWLYLVVRPFTFKIKKGLDIYKFYIITFYLPLTLVCSKYILCPLK